MSLWSLVKRSLVFYWRTNLGVLLTVVASTAVLTGALVVGDSVSYSLRRMATARLGKTQLALIGGKRFFRAALADELAAELGAPAAPVLQLRGLVSNNDGMRRANRIEVLGVDERFYRIGGGRNPFGDDWSEGVVLNEPLAARLGVRARDEVVLRIEKPDLMPKDAPLTLDSDLSVAFRLAVRAVAGESEFGLFSLQANQAASLNVFVPIEWLQEKVGLSVRANTVLVAERREGAITVEQADKAIRKCWKLADASLELRQLERQGVFEVRSTRIFIEEPLSEAAMNVANNAIGVFTYFVNGLRLGDRMTPYSIVTAIGKSAGSNVIPPDMRDDEILINTWLAGDLDAKVGDVIELGYLVVGPMRKLQEKMSRFKVRGIIPMDSVIADRELMPDFPGLADVDNCRDWKPGVPIDLDKIRKQDENYWLMYRGTPKAFVTLEAGRAMWSNRYGNLTAVRYPLSKELGGILASNILERVEPSSVGLYFQPVRERGLKAGNEGTDFGQLFLGFSMFLVVSALLLTGLVFVFGAESRSEQIGMLLAVGYSPTLVRGLLLVEGGILAVLGSIAGTAAGMIYTKCMIYGLATMWRAAVSGSSIHFYAKPSTLLFGALGGVVISLAAIWLAVRKRISRPARELLAGNLEWQFFAAGRVSRAKTGLWVAALAATGAAALLAVVWVRQSSEAAGFFFGAGALLLIAGLGLSHSLLRMVGGGFRKPMRSLAGLGLRNSTRRSGRSLTVVGLLACGVFLVIAVGANRHNPLAEAQRRDSGTGGFALFGESAIGVLQDLNSDSGRKSLGLDKKELEGIEVVQLRVHDGDDASCLNLNRAQKPRLLGVRPEQLQVRGAFGFINVSKGADKKDAWGLLNREQGEGVAPAIGDYATVIWALGKSIGDELEYSDEKGQTFKLRIVGILKSSILQGSLLIAEDEFIERFPSEDGYRMFLIDAAQQTAETAAEKLSGALKDFGLELTPAVQRLAAFSVVENTYLSIFQMLGGLGLVLGSVGLGLVVLRNVVDRRGELGMLRAVGFDKAALKRMVFYEHSGLMLAGLVCGVAAAVLAVGPALRSPGAQVPYFSLILMVTAIAVSGIVWIRIAAGFALSGRLLDALRNE
ncbi:MAG TPA: ABC transporter permease [Sedimentisphaerales bacterium]|nr:ABC transporter permease [Sedimentisphaerales bacterium]